MTDEPKFDPTIEQQPISPQSIQIPVEAMRRINFLEAQLAGRDELIDQIMVKLVEGLALPAMFDPSVRKQAQRLCELLDKWRSKDDKRNKQI